MTGRVLLVGAGPGDPDLLTVRADRELQLADVVLYDALIPAAILARIPAHVERVDVGKRGDGTRGVSQDSIAEKLVEYARAGRRVVRLKGGDPTVFARGGEEASVLAAAGIPFEIVPGVTSAIAVPAYAGIPITDRRRSSSVAIVTGHRAGSAEDSCVDWEGLARSADTLVVLMGTAWVEEIVSRVLRAGRDPETPSAVIANGTRPNQRTVVAPLKELAPRARAAGIASPTVIVVGEVVRFRTSLAWYEERPLFAKRALVLRGVSQRDGLLAELARAGALGVSVPLLSFESLGTAQVPVDAYDWVVFASANSVRFAPARPPESSVSRVRRVPRVACIGASSAEAARSNGWRVDLVPDPPSTPEHLVATLERAGLGAGQRVWLPRAQGAGDTLPEELRARGATVDTLEAYRNVLPEGAVDALERELVRGVDAVLLTSPSTVERLCGILGAERIRALVESVPFVCVGPTTAAALRGAGLEPAGVASEQSDRGLVAALEACFAEESDHAVS